MTSEGDKTTVFFMLGVMAFAVILVDDRWVRAGLGLLPALLLAQRAVMGVGVGATGAERGTRERRTDTDLRDKIQDLLKLIRDFYTTCHMVTVGQLEPSKAKAKAQLVERHLNQMMADIMETDEGPDAG